ncbi:T-complex protein 1 subunit beta [Arachnomyces sp. PD_36]|nr:T-complex protein 1 subunit beta [Arachnomyces sp. PD_36]
MSFRFPNLSPAQVENASFTPQVTAGVYVPAVACAHGFLDHHTAMLERELNHLQERFDKQEHRIKRLEEKLEKNTLKHDAEAVVDSVMNVVESSITQANSARALENFKLRQKLNRMARENRTLVSNLHLALHRRNISVTPKTMTPPQSVDNVVFVGGSDRSADTASLIDINTTEPRGYSSDLIDLDSSFRPSVESNKAEETKVGHPVGILVEGLGPTLDEMDISSKVPPNPKLSKKPLQVSDSQPAASAKLASSGDRRSHHSRRMGSNTTSTSARKVAPAPVPWDGHIKWVTKKAFNNPEEEMVALRSSYGSSRGTGADLGLFQHGLVFSPDDDEENIYRAVTITGIPGQVNMANVLESVCGGQLYSAHLLRTTHLTGSHTALITFLYEEDAREFVKSTFIKDVVYFGKRAKVSLVRTPTFPIPKLMKHYIFNKGHTRCLSIFQAPEQHSVNHLLEVLLAWNSVYAKLLEGIRTMDSGETVTIRFHSIHAAGMACFALSQHQDYKDCVIKFAPDPCDRPAF